MRRYVKELRPTELGDIIAMVALYRPGPMELIRDFIAGKHGAKTPQYLHPKLKPILEDTYGIAVYQEQVLQIAREIAGFSLGEADILRKAIGKKIQRLLISQRNKFIEGALKNQVKKETAEKIFDFIEPFARYSFNRAHAAGYGLISYQTAYLKTNYPQEFMAALLTSEQNNLDKIGIIIAECSRLGLNVFPPDVNESFPEFGLVPNTKNIRFGLSAIKNVGAALAEKIVEERKLNGLYKSLEDFLSRLAKNQQVNKKNLESLAKVGALDVFAERNAILAGMEMVLKFLQKAGQQAANGQLDLFGSSAKTRQPISLGHLQLPAIEAATEQQRLNWEKELLGIYISSHPLKKISHLIEKNGTAISFLNGEMTGERVRVAGIITSIKKIQTKSGEPMLFVRFEDTTANTEIIVFPRLLERSGMLWRPNNIVAVEGTINTKDGAVKIVADKIEELGEQETWEEILPLIIIFPLVTTKELLFRVKKILAENPGDRPVILRFPQNGEEKEIKLKNKIADSKALLGELKTVGVLTKS